MSDFLNGKNPPRYYNDIEFIKQYVPEFCCYQAVKITADLRGEEKKNIENSIF